MPGHEKKPPFVRAARDGEGGFVLGPLGPVENGDFDEGSGTLVEIQRPFVMEPCPGCEHCTEDEDD